MMKWFSSIPNPPDHLDGKTLVKLANIGPWVRLAWSVRREEPSFTFEAKITLKT